MDHPVDLEVVAEFNTSVVVLVVQVHPVKETLVVQEVIHKVEAVAVVQVLPVVTRHLIQVIQVVMVVMEYNHQLQEHLFIMQEGVVVLVLRDIQQELVV